jgi:hypothetical protein
LRDSLSGGLAPAGQRLGDRLRSLLWSRRRWSGGKPVIVSSMR